MKIKYGEIDKERLQEYLLSAEESAKAEEVQDMAINVREGIVGMTDLSPLIRKQLVEHSESIQLLNKKLNTLSKSQRGEQLRKDLTALQEDVGRLDVNLEGLVDDMEKLRYEQGESENKVVDLCSDMEKRVTEADDLRYGVEELNTEMSALQGKMEAANALSRKLSGRIDGLCIDMEEREGEEDDLRYDVEELKNEVSNLQDELEITIEDIMKDLKEDKDGIETLRQDLKTLAKAIDRRIIDLRKDLEGVRKAQMEGPDSPESFRQALENNGKAIQDIQQLLEPFKNFRWPSPDDQTEAALAWCEELQLNQESSDRKLNDKLRTLEKKVYSMEQKQMKNEQSPFSAEKEAEMKHALNIMFKKQVGAVEEPEDQEIMNDEPGSVIIGQGATINAPVSTQPINIGVGADLKEIESLLKMIVQEVLDDRAAEEEEEEEEELAVKVVEVPKDSKTSTVFRVLEFIVLLAGLIALYIRG